MQIRKHAQSPQPSSMWVDEITQKYDAKIAKLIEGKSKEFQKNVHKWRQDLRQKALRSPSTPPVATHDADTSNPISEPHNSDTNLTSALPSSNGLDDDAIDLASSSSPLTSPSTRSSPIGPHSGLPPSFQQRQSSSPIPARRSRLARDSHSPRARPTMSFQTTGSTQEFSQEYFRSSRTTAQEHVRALQDGVNQDNSAPMDSLPTSEEERRYATGDTGYIRFATGSGSGVEAENLDEEEEEIEEPALPLGMLASQFPEDRRFKTPKTPASRGRKRARDGEVLEDQAVETPGVPVNPFAAAGARNPGLMGLSQAFRATQAPSSPLPNLPTSDGLSERPSPHLGDVGRPNTAPASSPVKLQETPLKSETGPYAEYTPMAASQKAREKVMLSSPQVEVEPIDLDSPEVQRGTPAGHFTARRLAGLSARLSTSSGRGRGSRLRGGIARRKTASNSFTRPATSPGIERLGPATVAQEAASETVSRFEDRAAPVHTPEALRHEDAEQEAKENGGSEEDEERQVQVPATVSKKRQLRTVAADSPPAKHKSPSKVKRGSSQPVGAANSQPWKNAPRSSKAQGSSASGGILAPLSQVPESTDMAGEQNVQMTHSQPKASAPTQQSQTFTPPSSSPSPQRPASRMPNDGDMELPDTLPAPILEAGPKPDSASPAGSDDEVTSPMVARSPTPDLPNTFPETVSPQKQPKVTPKKSSPVKRRTPHAKRLEEVIPTFSPGTQGADDLDLPDIWTVADEEFHNVMEDKPEQRSPLKPVRKRPRALAPRRNSNQHVLNPPVSAPNSSQPETGHFQTARVAQDETPVQPRESSVTTPEPNNSEKENEPTPRRKRPAADAALDTEPGSKKTEPSAVPASTYSEPVRVPGRKRRRFESPSLLDANEVSEADGTEADGTEVPQITTPMLQLPPEPTMVWAFFNGVDQKGFFPARCLGPAENNKVRVRFEDCNEATIPSSSVRRLELRVGDMVKIWNKDTKTNVYVIQELADRQFSGPPMTQIQTISDIYGWTKVRLALKSKDGSLDVQDTLVSVSFLYLTQTLFNGLKDRAYSHPFESVIGRTRTPSVSASMPPTPASHHRRAKLSVKKESGLRQSFKVSTNQRGLFSGMAFAITAIEGAKRIDLQSSIHNNGGTLLMDGFKELFEAPSDASTRSSDGAENTTFKLGSEAESFGFTALLTEKHCRTSAYLHALALNIPCISVCWIKDCLSKQDLLDWRPYLLASGESQVLDGATRSRVLNIPISYSGPRSSAQWSLSSMFETRSRLMDGANVIIVSNNAVKRQMEAYLFIAYAIGASRVALAQGWNEAESYLKDGKQRWNWICCPDEAEAGASQKGRKRKSAVAATEDGGAELGVKWKDGVKVVKPEFVVQSLVLGRLVAE